MTETILRLLRAIQDGLPITERPYQQVAERLHLGERETVELIEQAQAEKIIRRLCAFIAHRRVGILYNAMCVWDMPDENIETAGALLAASPFVTHAYERPRGRDWPYNLYAMIHSHDETRCRRLFKSLTEAMGNPPGEMLFSLREFKKESLRI